MREMLTKHAAWYEYFKLVVDVSKYMCLAPSLSSSVQPGLKYVSCQWDLFIIFTSHFIPVKLEQVGSGSNLK